MPNPYSILGVHPDADFDFIKKRYRQLLRENHPDLNPDKPDCNRIVSDLNNAYRSIELERLRLYSKRSPREKASGFQKSGNDSSRNRNDVTSHREDSSAKPSPPNNSKVQSESVRKESIDAFSSNLLFFSILAIPIVYIIGQIVKMFDLLALAGIFFAARFYRDINHLPRLPSALILKTFYFFAGGVFLDRGTEYLCLNFIGTNTLQADHTGIFFQAFFYIFGIYLVLERVEK